MKKENQVCTLEQAEKLFHLGVKYNEPQYAYVLRLDEMKLANVEEYNRWGAQYDAPSVGETTHYPAFTVAELGVMLPNGFDTVLLSTYDDIQVSGWKPYDDSDDNPLGYEKFFKTEAEARAGMLIYLVEKKLIKIETINHRLQAA